MEALIANFEINTVEMMHHLPQSLCHRPTCSNVLFTGSMHGCNASINTRHGRRRLMLIAQTPTLGAGHQEQFGHQLCLRFHNRAIVRTNTLGSQCRAGSHPNGESGIGRLARIAPQNRYNLSAVNPTRQLFRQTDDIPAEHSQTEHV